MQTLPRLDELRNAFLYENYIESEPYSKVAQLVGLFL